MTEREIKLNKEYRGRIMRLVAMFYPTPTSLKQLQIGLLEYGMSSQADIDKHLHYLEDRAYITRKEADMYNITADGIDLIEGTKSDDGLLL